MHAQCGRQLEDIQQRKITFASFDISQIAWMNVGGFCQFCQRHSMLVAEFTNRLPKNDLFALVLKLHATILEHDL